VLTEATKATSPLPDRLALKTLVEESWRQQSSSAIFDSIAQLPVNNPIVCLNLLSCVHHLLMHGHPSVRLFSSAGRHVACMSLTGHLDMLAACAGDRGRMHQGRDGSQQRQRFMA
jgi:hypothetical protein